MPGDLVLTAGSAYDCPRQSQLNAYLVGRYAAGSVVIIHFSQAQIDALLLEGTQGGDLTVHVLGIDVQPGVMTFYHRQGGYASGTTIARQMFTSSGLTVSDMVVDDEQVSAGQRLIRAYGNAAALHQGWKAIQNVLEWSCGVSDYLESVLSQLHQCYPDGWTACTRKAILGTRLSVTQAILAVGGIIHYGGCTETVLLFANHRHFLTSPNDWSGAIARLRCHAPERKIVVEIDAPDKALAALRVTPDVLQPNRSALEQATEIIRQAPSLAPHCAPALTGGITLASLAGYLDCGIRLFITSVPYHAPPADIKVNLSPDAYGV